MNGDRPISDDQTIKKAFEELSNIESYEEEKLKFLSICDEWYKVLEPEQLMNHVHKELLRRWITNRQYANTEDPVVSQVIKECSMPRKETEQCS